MKNLTSFRGTALLIATAISSLLFSQSPSYVWAKGVGGTGADQGMVNKTDGAGNVIVAGTFSGTADFDPGAGTANLISAGSTDIFIAKYNSTGDYTWAFGLGSTNSDSPGDFAIDGSNNIVVTGGFIGTVDFDPGAGVANLTSASGSTPDIFIAKYDASGNYVWAERIGSSTGGDQGKGIAFDSGGNIIISGYFFGTADFDPGAGTANLVSFGSFDACLAKYDASGNYIWAKKMGGVSSDQGGRIAIDGSGNIDFTGTFNGTADFDPSAGVANLTSAGATDIFLGQYNSSGSYLWADRIGGTLADQSSGIGTDGSNNVLLNGYFNGTADFDPGAGTANLVSAGGSDIFLGKYSSAGAYVWAGKMGGTLTDQGSGLVVDGSGNSYTTGLYTGAADFDPSAANANLISAGSTDAFMAMYNSSGAYVSAKSVGGTGGDAGNNITLNSSGDLIVAGYFSGTADFDPSAATANLVSAGSTDIFYGDYLMCTFATASLSSQTNVSCNGGSDGSATITAGGGSSFTYSWAPSGGTAATASGLTAATYTCTVTNQCGNTATQTVIITQPIAITSSISSQTNVTCNGGNDGSATVSASGGTGAFTYSWSPSGGSAATGTSLSAGTYTCTITDANGCTHTQTATITQPSGILSSISSQTDNTCFGGSSGSATVSASGGTGALTYSWSPSGGTASTASGLAAATYTCTITDASGCTHTQTVTITQPTIITTSVSSQSNVSCNGANDGSATIAASGGTPGYTYSWAPSGGSAASASGLSPGTYTVTVTDANGCVVTQTLTITEPAVLVASTGGNATICAGSSTTLTAGSSGGTAVVTFNWMPGSLSGSSVSVSPAATTTYTVTATDAHGCTSTATSTVTVNPLPTVTASASPASMCSGNSSTLTSTGATTYSWNPGSMSGASVSVSPVATTTYTVTGTDGNGCVNTATVTVTINNCAGSMLTPTWCGATLTSMTQNFYWTATSGATNYHIRVQNASLGYSQVVTRTNNLTYTNLGVFTGILYSTTYNVDISAYVGGVWGAYGNVCTLTTPPTPTSQLTGASCGATGVTNATNLYYSAVTTATNYKIRMSNAGLGYSQILTRGNNSTYYRISSFTGLLTNTTYNVDISAYVAGVWGAYGTVCTITTASALRYAAPDDPNGNSDAASFSVYPNPSPNGSFNVSLNSFGNDQGSAQIEMFDLLGNLVYAQSYAYSYGDIITVESPAELVTGIYVMRITANGISVNEKVSIER
ncbi:MAG: T9SS type A sorting domain-containing protein [Bacteroidetes bacterium]|nr:T9SS type A sorting domain-containing protein [Bacteroidota bacterium]